MQVLDAAAGDGAAEVEAEVEGVGFQRSGEEALGEGKFLEEVGTLGGGEVVEIGNLPERDGEQVAGVIGEAIEDQVGQRAAVDNERGAVVTEGGQFREGAFHRGRITRRFDVVHAPVGVKLLHVWWAKRNEAKRALEGSQSMERQGACEHGGHKTRPTRAGLA